MKKTDLEAKLARVEKNRSMCRDTLVEIRQLARDFIKDGKVINNVWLLEKITTVLTRIEP